MSEIIWTALRMIFNRNLWQIVERTYDDTEFYSYILRRGNKQVKLEIDKNLGLTGDIIPMFKTVFPKINAKNVNIKSYICQEKS